jgi:hypothetical protein
MTPQECLFRALQCERLAASSSEPAVKRALLASAALWRRMASVSPSGTVPETPNKDRALERTAVSTPVVQEQLQVQQQQQQQQQAEGAQAVTPGEKPKT